MSAEYAIPMVSTWKHCWICLDGFHIDEVTDLNSILGQSLRPYLMYAYICFGFLLIYFIQIRLWHFFLPCLWYLKLPIVWGLADLLDLYIRNFTGTWFEQFCFLPFYSETLIYNSLVCLFKSVHSMLHLVRPLVMATYSGTCSRLMSIIIYIMIRCINFLCSL